MDSPSWLLYAGSWAATSAAVWGLFERAELVLSDRARSDIARWLMTVRPPRGPVEWPARFADTFDSVFGQRHLTWVCFRRSCLASFVAIAILFLLCLAVLPGRFGLVFDTFTTLTISMLAAGTLLSVGPDYLSLLKTRSIISLMRRQGLMAVGGLLLADVATTALIASTTVVIAELMTGGRLDRLGTTLMDTIALNVSYVEFRIPSEGALVVGGQGVERTGTVRFVPFAGGPYVRSYSPFFYAAFFTSFWAWAYAAAAFCAKSIRGSEATLGVSRRLLDIENKPLRCLGYLLVLLLSSAYLLAAPLFFDILN